jgi:hypothetical protein
LVSFDLLSDWRANNCDAGADGNKQCVAIFNKAEAAIGVVLQPLRQNRAFETNKNKNDRMSSKTVETLSSSPSSSPPYKYTNEPSLDPDDLYEDFCTGNATLYETQTDRFDCAPINDVLAEYLVCIATTAT